MTQDCASPDTSFEPTHPKACVIRRRLTVTGTVQGVGFRPWVYQNAHAHRLAGFVSNTPYGVIIEVEGPEDQVETFVQTFARNAPPLADISTIACDALALRGDTDFVIRASSHTANNDAFSLIPSDVATCPDCLADLRDPANRRHNYPFTNCTNCGPRYTIIQDVPYDRPATTMAAFPMCPDCEAEYHDPSNRRFHAQPNACPQCGPHLELRDHNGAIATHAGALTRAHQLLGAGAILAIKGLGGFHLACDAANDDAVRLLRDRKRRSGKPFAIMAANEDAARELCVITPDESRALQSPRRPIVLLTRRSRAPISQHVAPNVGVLGIMLPYTPLHHLLFDGAPYKALVMTSGNLSEEPISSLDEEIALRLHPLADFVLRHDRVIQTRVDDSVVRVFLGRERTLRRARGYAPAPIDLGHDVPEVLACGGELKNTFCLTRGHYAILSQHIGDLENVETMQAYEQTLDAMQRFYRIQPSIVAYDPHPRYYTTRFAMGLPGNVRKVAVQHHHAHIVSCMADNRLSNDPVIGVAFDGTGYGTDGKIWGGEFLVCDDMRFERAYHFRYVPLPGGDAAIRQPWRSALAYLRDAGIDPGDVLRSVPAEWLRIVDQMVARKINTIDCTSAGRLFDAAAAIGGIALEATYEGQAAMEWEARSVATGHSLPFDFDGNEIDFRAAVRAMVQNPGPLIPSRFHTMLSQVVLEGCRRLRQRYGIRRVCLSGGSFQNQLLLTLSTEALTKQGFDVYSHARVPANDGGLCLGQAVVAARAGRS